jgi:MFS family permease
MSVPDRSAAPASAGGMRTATLIAVCVGVCLAQLAIAMPATLSGALQENLHLTGSQVTWVSDVLLLPITVLELTFGVLGDLFGRKRLLTGGAALLAAGELISALAHDSAPLLAGQLLSGIAAAALFPSTLAMVAAGTRTLRERARGIAVWGAAMAIGGGLAPLLGGLTATYGSLPLSFYSVAALAVIGVIISRFAQDSNAPQGRSLDWAGQVTIVVGLSALIYGVIQGPSDGWSSPRVVTAFVTSAVFLVLFLFAESRVRSPLLQLRLFRNRDFAAVSVVAVVGMFSFLGFAYATSFRLGVIQHLSPILLAVPFLAANGVMVVQAPVTARLLERARPRVVLCSGALLIAVGAFWMAALSITNRSVVAVLAPQIIVGVGAALLIASISAVAVNSVPAHLAGMASGSISMLRDLGLTLGPAIVGAVALSRASSLFGKGLEDSALPPGLKAAAGAVAQAGGPLAVNSVPPNSPPGQAAPIAMAALGSGYSLGFAVCGVAAVIAGLLAVVTLRGASRVAGADLPSPAETTVGPAGREAGATGSRERDVASEGR